MQCKSLLLMICLTALGSWLLARGSRPGNLARCKDNLAEISTALELYASEHRGRYPERLSQLVAGDFMKALPTCPAAGFENYSSTYQSATEPDNFTFGCRGRHHGEPSQADDRNGRRERYYCLPEAFPAYNASAGCTLGLFED